MSSIAGSMPVQGLLFESGLHYIYCGGWNKRLIADILPSFCIIRSDEQGYRYRGECEHPEK